MVGLDGRRPTGGAEEADRLDLSLDVVETVLADPALAGWDGFGVVVQAYGKRARCVIDWLHELAGKLERRIMVRLVKGAYWDTEVKRAQDVRAIRDGCPTDTPGPPEQVCGLPCAAPIERLLLINACAPAR